jgi:hypothetical protein
MSDLEQMNVELQGLKKISAKKQADKAAGLGIGLGAMLAIAGIVLFAPNPQATDGNEALFVLACASSFLLPLVLGVGFYKLTIKRLGNG